MTDGYNTKCGELIVCLLNIQLFFVLHNYNIRSQLQSQERVILNTSDLDVNISAGYISQILKDDVTCNDVACIKKMLQRLHTHSGNLTGTQPYRTSTSFLI